MAVGLQFDIIDWFLFVDIRNRNIPLQKEMQNQGSLDP